MSQSRMTSTSSWLQTVLRHVASAQLCCVPLASVKSCPPHWTAIGCGSIYVPITDDIDVELVADRAEARRERAALLRAAGVGEELPAPLDGDRLRIDLCPNHG